MLNLVVSKEIGRL